MIEAHELTRCFNGLTAVDQANFKIPQGSICGFIGPSGAGKTTTMRMLVTLDTPSFGYATLNGCRIDTEPDKVRHYVGYMPDYYGKYPNMTCSEYLDFFARAYKREVKT